jgi:hypothetical protein
VFQIISIVLFLFATVFSPWFNRLSLLATVLVIIFTIVLFLSKKFSKYKLFLPLVPISYLLLLIFQISTTRIITPYEFSGNDQFIHQQQLDSYPPYLYRLANIVENKLDSPIVVRLRQNIFDSLDFIDYFKNYFYVYLFIPFIFGLVKLISHPDNLFTIPFFVSVVILTFIGSKGLYGPIIMLPFIINLICFYPFEK